jgi:hypothetical protein
MSRNIFKHEGVDVTLNNINKNKRREIQIDVKRVSCRKWNFMYSGFTSSSLLFLYFNFHTRTLHLVQE